MEFYPWRIVTLLVPLSSILAPLLTLRVLPPRTAPSHVGFNVSLHSAAQRDAAGSSDPSLAQSQRRLCLASAHYGRPLGNVPLGHREYTEQ